MSSNIVDRIANRSSLFGEQYFSVEDGAVVIDDEAARQIRFAEVSSSGQTINPPRVMEGVEDGAPRIIDAVESFAASIDAPVTVDEDAVGFSASDLDVETASPGVTGPTSNARINQQLGRLGDVQVEPQGPDAADMTLRTVAEQLDDATVINVGDRSTINLPGGAGGLVFGSDESRTEFGRALGNLDVDELPADLTVSDLRGDPDLREDMDARAARAETREAARDAAESAGVDLDEFGIDARADGTVIVQDRDANTTRTIDPDAPGGVGSAIDAATGNGQFVADDADPAASGSGFGDGLGARAAGAIVLLFGAVAAALGWLS